MGRIVIWGLLARLLPRVEAEVRSPPSIRVLAIRAALVRIAVEHWPYIFGGGHHEGKLGPSVGEDTADKRKGLDCSGAISWALSLAKVLGYSYPLSTAGLIKWAAAGEGAYITVWVRNDKFVQHAVIQVKHLGTPTEWFEAGHSGMTVGWIKDFDPTGYTPRRLP